VNGQIVRGHDVVGLRGVMGRSSHGLVHGSTIEMGLCSRDLSMLLCNKA
jgi:hypothetical protein